MIKRKKIQENLTKLLRTILIDSPSEAGGYECSLRRDFYAERVYYSIGILLKIPSFVTGPDERQGDRRGVWFKLESTENSVPSRASDSHIKEQNWALLIPHPFFTFSLKSSRVYALIS